MGVGRGGSGGRGSMQGADGQASRTGEAAPLAFVSLTVRWGTLLDRSISICSIFRAGLSLPMKTFSCPF